MKITPKLRLWGDFLVCNGKITAYISADGLYFLEKSQNTRVYIIRSPKKVCHKFEPAAQPLAKRAKKQSAKKSGFAF